MPARRVKVPTPNVTVGGAHYSVQIWEQFFPTHWTWPVVMRNGREERIRLPEDGERATFMHWPFEGELLVVRGYAASSEHTWYYRVGPQGITGPMAELDSGLNGGPRFKDIDHDGRPEMIFDNYSWYLREDGPRPDKFLVYKVGRSGTTKFWKAVPNLKHEQLKDVTGL